MSNKTIISLVTAFTISTLAFGSTAQASEIDFSKAQNLETQQHLMQLHGYNTGDFDSIAKQIASAKDEVHTISMNDVKTQKVATPQNAKLQNLEAQQHAMQLLGYNTGDFASIANQIAVEKGEAPISNMQIAKVETPNMNYSLGEDANLALMKSEHIAKLNHLGTELLNLGTQKYVTQLHIHNSQNLHSLDDQIEELRQEGINELKQFHQKLNAEYGQEVAANIYTDKEIEQLKRARNYFM